MQDMLDLLTAHRRALHKIPEMGNSEWKTHAYLREQLALCAPDQLEGFASTGLRAVYLCGIPGARTLAFRADIDALPVKEPEGCTFRSQHEGMMHACGHDGHMAALLAFAYRIKTLKEQKTLRVNAVLLFQPAEETTGGAQRMIGEGALENPHVDEIFGFHLMPEYPVGTIALSPGGVMAANTEFDLHFLGKAAHGAMPHLGSDAAAALCMTYGQLQTLISRLAPPTEPVVLTMGRVYAGNIRNVVADEGGMEGILRSYDNALQQALLEKFADAARAASAPYGVTVSYAEHCYYPSVVNDEALTTRTAPLIGVHARQKPLLTAEDFSFFALARPSVYAFVGVRDETHTHPLHSEKFGFDERALLPALQWYEAILGA